MSTDDTISSITKKIEVIRQELLHMPTKNASIYEHPYSYLSLLSFYNVRTVLAIILCQLLLGCYRDESLSSFPECLSLNYPHYQCFNTSLNYSYRNTTYFRIFYINNIPWLDIPSLPPTLSFCSTVLKKKSSRKSWPKKLCHHFTSNPLLKLL